MAEVDLYDEFGNYIGPELDSESGGEDEVPHFHQQDAFSGGAVDEVRASMGLYMVWFCPP